MRRCRAASAPSPLAVGSEVGSPTPLPAPPPVPVAALLALTLRARPPDLSRGVVVSAPSLSDPAAPTSPRLRRRRRPPRRDRDASLRRPFLRDRPTGSNNARERDRFCRFCSFSRSHPSSYARPERSVRRFSLARLSASGCVKSKGEKSAFQWSSMYLVSKATVQL